MREEDLLIELKQMTRALRDEKKRNAAIVDQLKKQNEVAQRKIESLRGVVDFLLRAVPKQIRDAVSSSYDHLLND